MSYIAQKMKNFDIYRSIYHFWKKHISVNIQLSYIGQYIIFNIGRYMLTYSDKTKLGSCENRFRVEETEKSATSMLVTDDGWQFQLVTTKRCWCDRFGILMTVFTFKCHQQILKILSPMAWNCYHHSLYVYDQ